MTKRLPLTLLIGFFSIATLFAQMPPVAPTKSPTPAAQKATVIYLVRHAEKAAGTGDVELSEAGQKRAACLAATLADSNILAIYTTEYKRTVNTAAPTATRTGVTPTVVGGAEMDKLIAALQKETGRNVLVVGHSNTVPKVIEKLGAGAATIKDDEYDHLYVVTLLNGEASLASLRYCH
jgi:2,3-bisphosphoglycerate-dependent phosphoglycerate mutase